MLESGSVKYDIFTKESGKYYRTTNTWRARSVGKSWIERNLFGKDGWSSKKIEIKFVK